MKALRFFCNPEALLLSHRSVGNMEVAIVELELLRFRSLIRHKKSNPVIVKKRFPGNACYPADFPDGI